MTDYIVTENRAHEFHLYKLPAWVKEGEAVVAVTHGFTPGRAALEWLMSAGVDVGQAFVTDAPSNHTRGQRWLITWLRVDQISV